MNEEAGGDGAALFKDCVCGFWPDAREDGRLRYLCGGYLVPISQTRLDHDSKPEVGGRLNACRLARQVGRSVSPSVPISARRIAGFDHIPVDRVALDDGQGQAKITRKAIRCFAQPICCSRESFEPRTRGHRSRRGRLLHRYCGAAAREAVAVATRRPDFSLIAKAQEFAGFYRPRSVSAVKLLLTAAAPENIERLSHPGRRSGLPSRSADVVPQATELRSSGGSRLLRTAGLWPTLFDLNRRESSHEVSHTRGPPPATNSLPKAPCRAKSARTVKAERLAEAAE